MGSTTSTTSTNTARVAAVRHRPAARWFSESRRLLAVKPVVLADIGEGEANQCLSFEETLH
jgi:hypothetical protein